MDGVSDMGGMDGFGKVEAEPNEPAFHAPWEGRVMALQRAVGFAGGWNTDMSRYAQERLPPSVCLSVSYYKRWALAMDRGGNRTRSRVVSAADARGGAVPRAEAVRQGAGACARGERSVPAGVCAEACVGAVSVSRRLSGPTARNPGSHTRSSA